MNTKNRIEKIARRTLAKRICIDEYVEERIQKIESTFSKLRDIYISLLYITLPDLTIYYI